MRLGDKDAFFDLYKSLYYDLANFGIRTCGDSELATDFLPTSINDLKSGKDSFGNEVPYNTGSLLLAEAAQRGYISGSSAAHYASGMKFLITK